jgi:hypothetical protein
VTTLRHPHIAPPLLIEVEDERVPAYVAAGWLLPEEPSTPDLDAPGDEAPTTPEEEK